jgi:hypothetical protein
MTVFAIFCHSKCGSYATLYLKSVTVLADTKEEALVLVKAWLIENDHKFIRPEAEWDVVAMGEAKKGVIDYDVSSDY